MKSTRFQLLTTLAATLLSAGFFAFRGLPPTSRLCDAAMDGDMVQARQALNWGVPADIRYDTTLTSLHVAALFDNKDVAALLIAYGADVNARTSKGSIFGKQPSRWNGTRAPKGEEVPPEINAKANTGRTPLYYVTSKEVAELLVAHGATINVKDEYGLTPLHEAAACHYQGVVELLIACGAEVNAKDKRGFTPLGWAVPIDAWQEEQGEVEKLLRRNGAK